MINDLIWQLQEVEYPQKDEEFEILTEELNAFLSTTPNDENLSNEHIVIWESMEPLTVERLELYWKFVDGGEDSPMLDTYFAEFVDDIWYEEECYSKYSMCTFK